MDSDKINVGCKVSLYDYDFDEEVEWKIVGSTEANSLEGKISNESPVGSAPFMGKSDRRRSRSSKLRRGIMRNIKYSE